MTVCDLCGKRISGFSGRELNEEFKRPGLNETCYECLEMLKGKQKEVEARYTNLATQELRSWWDDMIANSKESEASKIIDQLSS